MNRPSKVVRVAAIAAASALVLAACGGGGDEPAKKSTSGASAHNMPIYFVDGNTADYSKDFPEGTLDGVKATYPGAELGDDFKKRLAEVDPNLKDYTYGPESYDAVVVAALAAEIAKSDSSKAIAKEMQNASADGTKCTTYADCLKLVKAGTNIDYEGVSGPINFNGTGSPSAATIGIFQYDKTNNHHPLSFQTGEVTSGGDAGPGQSVEGNIPKGDGTFVIGSLLPQTGDLSYLGPPEIAGVDLAIKDINAAGGVLGKPAKHTKADSGDGTPNIAPAETDKLLAANADVIIGAASSSVSLSVIDKIVNAGVIQISPANTSTAFDTFKDKGLYFRTAPSDVLQGRVMATLVAQDGAKNIAILARQESYGEALANNVEKFFTQSGGTVAIKKLYAPDAANFTAEVAAVKAAKPDAIVVVSFDETKKIIPELIKAGIGPNK